MWVAGVCAEGANARRFIWYLVSRRIAVEYPYCFACVVLLVFSSVYMGLPFRDAELVYVAPSCGALFERYDEMYPDIQES